jgi:GNAT superfamily N-acetyltransferase
MVNRRSSTVRRARTNELHELAALLAAAFHDDPVWGPYFFPDQRRRLEGLTRFFAGELRQFMPHQQVWTIEDLAGVTVWAPPGHWQVPPRELLGRAPSIARAFGRGLPRVLRATTMVENQHPGDLHYYLSYLGVAPARQGNGLGTALLRPVLDRCDSQGAPAYLEATNKRNLPLYRRQGFEVREELDLPNGPRLWTMWREPGSG